ncbi:ArsR/SmtB family transcription factor [Planomonospora venezuelensis]|uniref:DNA-binding transcriptional ArsR family regulator n=1 Tax=Planomonospora venezuelensis TaxID=1999 RepID=A0A841D5E9_PLAVE|nr:helix-turn-helix domain-containing protein [Planomonospora venezuelensis]MBB5963667.1 DNA-binding transcriptional ArsR family regulator [Planomonospora venezuelensis]GIN01455.1 transcriptional regulator [Planomonospora venezuelensis]
MALTVHLGVAELAATRFSVSPLSETVSGLQQLSGLGRNPLTLRWLRWAADELACRPLDLSHTLPLVVSDRPSWPEFLVPAPLGAGPSIDDELAALRRTTAHQVRASLRRVFGERLPGTAAALSARPAAGLRTIAAELRAAHDRLVAPHWPRIRAVLDADVVHRARQLAAGGAERLFADLHPDLRWCDGRLMLGGEHWRTERVVNRGPGGLVLIPVVLGPPYVLIRLSTSTQTTVRYPARGVGALWTAGTRPPAGGAVRLLGRVRAELLEALRSPATTTDLARALGVTPSAVSQHLGVLRESGLVARERCGRNVLYVTTALGASLCEPSPGSHASLREERLPGEGESGFRRHAG